MLLTCVDLLLYIITDVCLTDIIVAGAVVVFEDHTVK